MMIAVVSQEKEEEKEPNQTNVYLITTKLSF